VQMVGLQQVDGCQSSAVDISPSVKEQLQPVATKLSIQHVDIDHGYSKEI
jgi:hypothetical protein